MPRTIESTEPAERAWRKPEPRWRIDEDGRRVRLYECPFCRDVGAVTLPAYQPDETAEDLVDFARLLAGKTYAYACPGCRGIDESVGSKNPPLSTLNQKRLRRWLEARRAQLEREQAEGAHEPVRPGRLPQVGRPMPPLSLFAQEEQRLEAAAVTGGGGDD